MMCFLKYRKMCFEEKNQEQIKKIYSPEIFLQNNNKYLQIFQQIFLHKYKYKYFYTSQLTAYEHLMC